MALGKPAGKTNCLEGHQNIDSTFFRIPITQNGAERSPKALIFHGQASMHAQTRTRVSGAHGDTTWKLGLPGLDSQPEPAHVSLTQKTALHGEKEPQSPLTKRIINSD